LMRCSLWVRTPPDWTWRKELTSSLEDCANFAWSIRRREHNATTLVLAASQGPVLATPAKIVVLVERVECGAVFTAMDRAGPFAKAEVTNLCIKVAGVPYLLDAFKQRVKRMVGGRCDFTVQEFKK
jgi:hypothetical protein